MRPITTQSFLTDLHTLKEAFSSGNDVKKSKTTGQLRTLYLHEKLANFAQDFFRGSQSKIDRRLDYKENAKKHIVEKMANFISASIGNKPGNDAFQHVYYRSETTIQASSKNFVENYIDNIEAQGKLALPDKEIKNIVDTNYPSLNLASEEKDNLKAIQGEFLKINNLVATVLPAASWIKKNIGWEGDQAIKFAKMMSNSALEGLPEQEQFKIAGLVLDATRKLIDSNKSELAITKETIEVFQDARFTALATEAAIRLLPQQNNPLANATNQDDPTKNREIRQEEHRNWINKHAPGIHTDEQITDISKKMSLNKIEGFTTQQKYDLVLTLNPLLKLRPETNSNLN